MPGLTTEALENLEKTFQILKENPHLNKVKTIHTMLGAVIYEHHLVLEENKLKEVVRRRMLRPCPHCDGNFQKQIECSLCGGSGEVNGEKEGKYLKTKQRG